MTPEKDIQNNYPKRKKLSEVKTKYSPMRKNMNNVNNGYVKGYKFGLMSLQLKKSSNPDDDAFFKNFEDLLNDDPTVAKKLGVIKIVNVRNSSKSNDFKLSSSGYR